jgi:hypothetical protein
MIETLSDAPNLWRQLPVKLVPAQVTKRRRRVFCNLFDIGADICYSIVHS